SNCVTPTHSRSTTSTSATPVDCLTGCWSPSRSLGQRPISFNHIFAMIEPVAGVPHIHSPNNMLLFFCLLQITSCDLLSSSAPGQRRGEGSLPRLPSLHQKAP